MLQTLRTISAARADRLSLPAAVLARVEISQRKVTQLALAQQDPGRKLYLAVPLDTFTTFFALPFIQSTVRQYQLALLVYDAEREEVVQWIS